jgi:hypothetical protein
MVRTILAATALCCLAPWSTAFAQSATQDINITATVPGLCTINGLATGSPVGTAVIPTTSGNVDVTPITPTGSPFANVVCNGPSQLQLTSLNGGVFNTASAAGFDNIINYSASATWHGVTATINTSTNPAASVGGSESGTPAPVATAGSGALSVTITPIANAQPLMVGTYSDTLRITLTPQ